MQTSCHPTLLTSDTGLWILWRLSNEEVLHFPRGESSLNSTVKQDSFTHLQPSEAEPNVPALFWLDFQPDEEMTEILKTEFQMRLLWGSKGAEVNQTERYEKFNQILTALSRKLEPPSVKQAELWEPPRRPWGITWSFSRPAGNAYHLIK